MARLAEPGPISISEFVEMGPDRGFVDAIGARFAGAWLSPGLD